MDGYRNSILKVATLIVMMFFVFALIFLSRQNKVVVSVNGNAIYESDLANMKKNAGNISRLEIINNAIYDLLAYQDAENLGIVVEKIELLGALEKLKNANPLIYNKIIDDHGSEEAYLEALKYNHIYKKHREYIINHTEKLPTIQQQEKYYIEYLTNLYNKAEIIFY